MTKLLVILSLIALTACQTTTSEDSPCSLNGGRTVMHLHNALKEKNRDLTWRNLSQHDQRIFITAFNKTPPPSQFKGDRVRFYYKPYASAVLMVISNEGCVSHAGYVPVHLIESWQQGIVPTVNKPNAT